MVDKIYFSSAITPHGYLSNFYPCTFDYFGVTWKSSEHAYQGMKAANESGRKWVSEAPNAGVAKKRGREVVIRKDWLEVRVPTMKEVVTAKFLQNPALLNKLLATENAYLVEYAPWGDTFWGVNKEYRGKNMLGKTLMEVRYENARITNK